MGSTHVSVIYNIRVVTGLPSCRIPEAAASLASVDAPPPTTVSLPRATRRDRGRCLTLGFLRCFSGCFLTFCPPRQISGHDQPPCWPLLKPLAKTKRRTYTLKSCCSVSGPASSISWFNPKRQAGWRKVSRGVAGPVPAAERPYGRLPRGSLRAASRARPSAAGAGAGRHGRIPLPGHVSRHGHHPARRENSGAVGNTDRDIEKGQPKIPVDRVEAKIWKASHQPFPPPRPKAGAAFHARLACMHLAKCRLGRSGCGRRFSAVGGRQPWLAPRRWPRWPRWLDRRNWPDRPPAAGSAARSAQQGPARASHQDQDGQRRGHTAEHALHVLEGPLLGHIKEEDDPMRAYAVPRVRGAGVGDIPVTASSRASAGFLPLYTSTKLASRHTGSCGPRVQEGSAQQLGRERACWARPRTASVGAPGRATCRGLPWSTTSQIST